MVKAVQDYYEKIGVGLKEEDILITTGGSEALQILMNVILDPGSEVLIPEPFYPNYNTVITLAGGVIHPIPTPRRKATVTQSARRSKPASMRTQEPSW